MAYEQPLFSVSKIAAKNLTTAQYCIVRLTTADQITAPTCGKRVPLGVLQDKPTSGGVGNVMVMGISKAKVAAAVSRGQLVGLNTATTNYPGLFQAVTTATKATTMPIGRALQGAAQAWDIIPIMFSMIPAGTPSC